MRMGYRRTSWLDLVVESPGVATNGARAWGGA